MNRLQLPRTLLPASLVFLLLLRASARHLLPRRLSQNTPICSLFRRPGSKSGSGA